MKLGIMQPYFMPYIGYFQLIAAVDFFIVYDNIEYTKKGWINRNRMLLNGEDAVFSIAMKKDSDKLYVVQRELSNVFNRNKLLSQIKGAYKRAPHFNETFRLLERIIGNEENNLFKYINYSLVETCRHLGIDTEIKASSSININHELKAQDKVLAMCDAMNADTYINAIGGVGIYSKDEFDAKGIALQFIKSKPFEYSQFGAPFIPWLSIIDVMMFNTVEIVKNNIYTNFQIMENIVSTDV